MILGWFLNLFDSNKDGAVNWGELISFNYTLMMWGVLITKLILKQDISDIFIIFVAVGSIGHNALEALKYIVKMKSLGGSKPKVEVPGEPDPTTGGN